MLVGAGGRELNMSLSPEQATQLDAVKEHYGYERDSVAVLALLALATRRIKRSA